MQTTHSLRKEQITPVRGILFCEPILGRYETDSGLVIIQDMKRNPKIEKMRVISIGGPFTIHGSNHCNVCGEGCDEEERPATYWAWPGDTIWMKRGFKKVDIEGKTHCFVPNEDIVATKSQRGLFSAQSDMVLVEP